MILVFCQVWSAISELRAAVIIVRRVLTAAPCAYDVWNGSLIRFRPLRHLRRILGRKNAFKSVLRYCNTVEKESSDILSHLIRLEKVTSSREKFWCNWYRNNCPLICEDKIADTFRQKMDSLLTNLNNFYRYLRILHKEACVEMLIEIISILTLN